MIEFATRETMHGEEVWFYISAVPTGVKGNHGAIRLKTQTGPEREESQVFLTPWAARELIDALSAARSAAIENRGMNLREVAGNDYM
jgi:hypothetical protein